MCTLGSAYRTRLLGLDLCFVHPLRELGHMLFSVHRKYKACKNCYCPHCRKFVEWLSHFIFFITTKKVQKFDRQMRHFHIALQINTCFSDILFTITLSLTGPAELLCIAFATFKIREFAIHKSVYHPECT